MKILRSHHHGWSWKQILSIRYHWKPYCTLPCLFSISGYTNNVIVASSIRIWTQFRRGLQTLSIGAPLAANPHFPPSLLDSTFSTWPRLGIKTLRELYVDSIFASFQQLIDKFLLPKGHFFRYLQVRNFVRSSFPQFPCSSWVFRSRNISEASVFIKGGNLFYLFKYS